MAAAALEQVDPGAALAVRLEPQAQCCRGGRFERMFGAVKKGQLAVFPGGELETPQAGKGNAFRPGHHHAAPAAAECLFARPQGLLRVTAAHHEQAVQPDAAGLQSRRVGQPGRVHQHHPLPGLPDVLQDGRKQAEFTLPGLSNDHFRYRAQRPATTGQTGIQPCIAGRNRLLPMVGAPPFPQQRRGFDQVVQRFALHRSSPEGLRVAPGRRVTGPGGSRRHPGPRWPVPAGAGRPRSARNPGFPATAAPGCPPAGSV